MKYYLIAGEASGDLHGSNLMRELKQRDPSASFRFWGGDLMLAQGGEMVSHYRERAYMGFVEVIRHLGKIMGFIKQCKEDILEYRPHVVILIDYPGFNLRIAEFAHSQGYRVFYYISPQVWAWKESRVLNIKKYVERMFVILPFEKEFYRKWNYGVDFVGHPLLDAIKNYGKDASVTTAEGKKILALLPGSRRQEIKLMLPVMLQMKKEFPQYLFVIAGAPSIPAEFYKSIIGEGDTEIWYDRTYELLQQAEAALVTSGTATLETALFKVPQVVCYKGNKISYLIARRLIRVKYISLVNLVMDQEIVKELIQDDLNPAKLKAELSLLLPGSPGRDVMLRQYGVLETKLGSSGASARTAEKMIAYLTAKNPS
jgi:lipid-A-disaccharide synthase